MGGEGVHVQNKREHYIILTKYEAMHPTAVSDNYFSSGDANNFDTNPNSIYFK